LSSLSLLSSPKLLLLLLLLLLLSYCHILVLVVVEVLAVTIVVVVVVVSVSAAVLFYSFEELATQVNIAHVRQQCHNSKFVTFQEKILKVLKCYNFL
jgi:hypothetical protein